MVILPAEWKHNNGNLEGLKTKNAMNQRLHNAISGLAQNKGNSPIIIVTEHKPKQIRTLSKDYNHGIDQSFKTRSSQLSDAHFKNMPKLIDVNQNIITGHYMPGFTYSDLDSDYKHRHVEKIHKKNEFGFDKTAVKDMRNNKISIQDIIHSVSNKNKLNYVSFDGDRHSCGRTPIIQIKQHRDKLIITT